MKLLKMLGEWWTEYLDYLLLWILLGFIFYGGGRLVETLAEHIQP